MKRNYTTPEMEMIVFEQEDIVTTSKGNETPIVPFNSHNF